MCAANGGAYSLLIEEKIMELRTGRNKTQVGLLLLPGVAMFAIFLIGDLLSSPIVNAKKYQQLLNVEERVFAEDIKEVDTPDDFSSLLNTPCCHIIHNGIAKTAIAITTIKMTGVGSRFGLYGLIVLLSNSDGSSHISALSISGGTLCSFSVLSLDSKLLPDFSER